VDPVGRARRRRDPAAPLTPDAGRRTLSAVVTGTSPDLMPADKKRISTRATKLLLLAACVGLAGGLLGAGFRWFTFGMQYVFLGPGESIVHAARELAPWQRLLIPTIGGLLAALVLRRIAFRRGPFGIADVMELVLTRKGTIRVRDSMTQILSSAVTIGTGGSIGREGANSQFAATVAEWLSRRFQIASRDRQMLLGCGIAAGMASAYKAPIAASLFVMEVVLGNFAMDVLAPVVVASVMSTIVTYAFFEERALYEIEHLALNDDARLVLSAIVLGALCGMGGIVFRHALDTAKRGFELIPAAPEVRMALGGLIIGAIGAFGFPDVWGNGQETVFSIADPGAVRATSVIFALLFWKVVATAVTQGSGGLGGVFTPNMFVGAAFGAVFGTLLQQIGFDANSEAPGRILASFALVGMAGLCSASTHAPISAIVLVFELTRDYDLILPLMLCSITASVVARAIDRDSMYTSRLRARGHDVSEGIEELTMKTTYVRDVMRTDPSSLKDTASFDEVLDVFQRTRGEIVYVTDAAGRLTGHVNLHDVKSFLNEGSLGSVVIAADLTRPTPSVHGDESLAAIIDRFDQLGELPVRAGESDETLIGRVTRRDLITCLSEEVLGQRKLRARLRRHGAGASTGDFVELPPGTELRRIKLPSMFAGRAFDSLDLHASARLLPLVLIRYVDGEEMRSLPRPEDLIEPGDQMILIGRPVDFEGLLDGTVHV
jgi:CIC family chloride channel protein